MTTADKKRILNVMVGSEPDEVLEAYLNVAGAKIEAVAYPFHTGEGVPPQYDMLQCEIAAYLINKRGAEGETSHSENGISRSYEDADVPASMLSVITPRVGTPR